MRDMATLQMTSNYLVVAFAEMGTLVEGNIKRAII